MGRGLQAHLGSLTQALGAWACLAESGRPGLGSPGAYSPLPMFQCRAWLPRVRDIPRLKLPTPQDSGFQPKKREAGGNLRNPGGWWWKCLHQLGGQRGSNRRFCGCPRKREGPLSIRAPDVG